jgi:integrase
MFGSAYAPSTRRKHTTAWRHWLRYLQLAEFSIPPIRPSELHICLWLVYLFKRHYSYNTIKTYLYSLASEIRIRGGKNIVIPYESWFVHTTLAYMKKSLGTGPITFRRPLTIDLLALLFKILDLKDYDTYVYACMLTMGVYCMLRVGELCYSKDEGVEKYIRNGDITFYSDYISYTLHNTKTDKDKRGVKKYIADIKSAVINPFDFMRMIKNIKTNSSISSEPFFTLKNGKPVSRPMLVKFLQDKMKIIFPAVPANEWTGISLRKGGATSAIRAGVAGEVIGHMGHWKSDVYKIYIVHEGKDIRDAQVKMAKLATSS